MTAPDPFPVKAVAKARPIGRLACEIDAGMRTPFEDRWRLATDEPKVQGGSGEAPPPLVLLAGALASCLSVQVRTFARRKRIDLPPTTVDISIEWNGYHEPPVYRAEGRKASATFRIDTDDAPGEWTQHVRHALQGCFVEALLSPSIDLDHRVATRSGEARL